MITLQQIAQVSTSNLKAGLVENIIETCPVLAKIPFVEAPSLRYEWALQKTLAASGFRALNGNYAATNSTYDRGKIDLKPLGGRFELDRLLVDIPDFNRERFYETELRARARSASMAFKRAMVKGNRANPAEFDGLQTWFEEGIVTTQVDMSAAGTTFTALGGQGTLDKMHEFINACIVIPDLILANRTIIANLTALSVATAANSAFATYFQMSKMDIGNGRSVSVGSFYGIPVIALDTDENGAEVLAFDEISPDGTSNTDCASMYAICLGENYFVGLQQVMSGPRVFEYTTSEGHKAVAVDWPAAIAIEHPRAVARLRGIRAA
ncbi:MAG: hypothetical protein IPJ01_12065 [Micavibrio sp.]|nr:hypothetical protein [Micavibrio sp.]